MLNGGERSSATPEVSRPQSQTAAATTCPSVVDPSHKRSIQAALDRKKQNCPMYISPVDNTSFPGCKHYAALCEQKASCCEMFFPCRLCHDEVIDEIPDVPKHTMNRFDVRVLRCTKCGHEQDVSIGDKSPTCGSCQTEFASYPCTECMLFHNAGDRDIYHCKDCRICRLGKRKDNFHCMKCDACVSKLRPSNVEHKCLESSIKNDCPVCLLPLHSSLMRVIYLPCGHALHEECFRELASRDYRCCMCLKSMGDMGFYFNQLDQIVEEDFENMPSELRGKEVEVLCNDCQGRSRVPFHAEFRKCRAVKQSCSQDGTKECGSYNTRLV